MKVTQDSINNVAVIIPAYNSDATICQAITSALMQDEASEVIVIDDASTDNTFVNAKNSDDGSGRLKIWRFEKNLGPSAARNFAVSKAQSRWIAVLDSDDYFLPGRLKGVLAYSNNADIIADDLWRLTNQHANEHRELLLGPDYSLPKFISFHEFIVSNISTAKAYRRELGYLKPVIRKEFLEKNCISYDEELRLGEDYILYAKCLASGAKFLLVPAQGYISVCRENSLSSNHSIEDLRKLRDSNKELMNLTSVSEKDKEALKENYQSINYKLQWRLLIQYIKQRDFTNVVKSFFHSYQLNYYLIHKLISEALLGRMKNILKRFN